jgi:hypothetical protein
MNTTHPERIGTDEPRQVLTYSAMSTFQTCRRRYRYRYEDHLVPIAKARALAFGSVTHEWLEVWHRDRSVEAAQAVIDRAYVNRQAGPDEKRDWHYQTAMLRAYAAQFAVEDFTVVDLERQFTGPLANPATGYPSRRFYMRGKVDGIVRRGDDYLVMENKTAGTLTGDYVERLAMDLQIQLYAYYAREALGFPVTGIIYNVLVKPRLAQALGETEAEYEARCEELISASKTGKTSAKRKVPETDEEFQARLAAWFEAEPRFTRIELLLDADTLAAVRQQLWDIGQEINAARRDGRWHQNGKACFGFGTCAYWPICSSKSNPLVIENNYRVEPPHEELSATPEEEAF